MNTKKRLGKGLEDISHLFLSRASSEPSPVRPNSVLPLRTEALKPDARIWLALSLVPRLPSSFFMANLLVEMARTGKRVLAVETASVPPLDEMLGTAPIHPSLNDLLEQPQKQITVAGPFGLKLLSFQLNLADLQGFASEEQEILIQVLSQEELEADVLLIHAAYNESSVFERWVGMVQGVILTADLSPPHLLTTYRVCKKLFHLNPDLRIGINVFGNQSRESASAGMKKLDEGMGHFLGKTVEWHGFIPDDPLIEQSITAKVPLTVLAQGSGSAAGFASSAKRLLPGAAGRTDPSGTFFGRLRQNADLVRG